MPSLASLRPPLYPQTTQKPALSRKGHIPIHTSVFPPRPVSTQPVSRQHDATHKRSRASSEKCDVSRPRHGVVGVFPCLCTLA